MKKIIYGTRSVAKSFNISRDVIRGMIKTGKIKPSLLRTKNRLSFAFDHEVQKKIDKYLNRKRKVDTNRPSS